MFKVCFLLLAIFGYFIHLTAAEFSHDASEKMYNFVAASFTPFMTYNYTLASACFEKSFPNGRWDVLNSFNLQPCNSIQDQCALWIVKSDIYKMIIFSFKGVIGKGDMNQTAHQNTDNFIPWTIKNVTYGLVEPDISKTSKGAYDYLFPMMISHRTYSFIFTGHSYAGGIASLTALNAKIVTQTLNISIFTFGNFTFDKFDYETSSINLGEPRYHNYELAQNFQKFIPDSSYRIIHNSDIIPHMPMCGTKFSGSCKTANSTSFYHRAQEIWYNNPKLEMNAGDQKICSSTEGEDPQCSDSISENVFLINFLSDRGVEMHMTYYNQKIDDFGLSGCGKYPCEDVDADCSTKLSECKSSLYKPVMCKFCKKTCNLCSDRACYN